MTQVGGRPLRLLVLFAVIGVVAHVAPADAQPPASCDNPMISVSVGPPIIIEAAFAEGDSGSQPLDVTIDVDVGGDFYCTWQISYRSVDGTATAGEDYDGIPPDTTQCFNGDNTNATPSLSTSIHGDTVAELDETFTIEAQFHHCDQAPIVATAQEVVTINNDDLPNIVVDDVQLNEGDSGTVSAAFTVRAEPLAPFNVFVLYETADGTATVADGDYVSQSGSVEIAPQPPYETTINVPVNGDQRLEDDETFFVRLTGVDGGIITDGEAVGTILNDEDEPSVSISNVQLAEGDSGRTDAVFKVSVSPLTQDVTVDFESQDGTATVADGDYVAVAGSLFFALGGEGTQRIRVPVVGDTRVEPDETFRVALSNVDGAIVSDGEGVATIGNDDEHSSVRLRVPDPVSEGAGSATVVVERTQPSGEPASVRVSARGGTATENADFTPVTATVNWAADEGGTRTVEIPILDDNLAEEEETIRITLSDPVEATLGSPSAINLSIFDDDQDGEVEIIGESDLERTIEESADLAVRVRKPDGTPIQGARVFWTIVEGEAELTSGNPVLSGPDGVSQQTVEVGPQPDVIVVRATLGEPSGQPSSTAAGARQGETEVVFTLRARGDLDLDSDPRIDPDNLSVGGVFDFACIEPEGDFAELCGFLFGLDDAQQAQVVRESTPREVAAQGNLMLDLPQWGFREVGRRLAALRGSGSRRVEEELAVLFDGREIKLASLAGQIRSAHARVQRLNQAVDEALDAAWQEPDEADGEALDESVVRSRMDEPDPPSRWGLFVSGRVATADRDGSDREEGFEAGIEGLTLGLDYLVHDGLILGAAGGFLTTDLDLLDDGGGLEADGYFLTGYGAWFSDMFYLDGVLGYGSNSFDLRRHIDLPVPFQGASRFVAEGDTDGSQWMANLGGGWSHAFGASSLEFYGRGSYIEADLDGYRERGAGPFSLSIQDQNLDSLLAEAGLTYAYASSRSWGVLQPQVRTALLHEFGDDSRLVRGSFIQDVSQLEFVVPTDEPDRSFANVGIGVTAVTYHGRSFYLWYDTDVSRDDLEVGTFTFGARFEF